VANQPDRFVPGEHGDLTNIDIYVVQQSGVDSIVLSGDVVSASMA
jgi:hypothetical protein